MKPVFEKLTPTAGQSFRCFNRQILKTEVKWHWHPEMEINFVEKGCGTRMVGDHIGDFGDNDLVLLGPNLPHTWLSDEYAGQKYDRHPSIVVQFLPTIIGGGLLLLPEMVNFVEMIKNSRRGILFKGEAVQRVGEKLKDMQSLSGSDRVIQLISCLNDLANVKNYVLLASRGFDPVGRELFDERLRKVCQFINLHFTDANLNLAEIPGLVEMNPSAFSRFFKKNMGRTLTQYVNELRIGMACRKLINTDKKILDICLEVGFGNLSNFNRRFLEMKGVSPSKYRKSLPQSMMMGERPN